MKILSLLRHLWSNEDGFFGIGMGPSSGEKNEAGKLGSLADFGTSEGMGDISKADDFWKSILSGDPTKISQVLGPQISGINKQAQQKKKTANEFGDRSGGTNAGLQMTDDSTRTQVQDLIGSLTGKAAGELGSTGSGLLSLGASAHEGTFAEDKTIHDQHSAAMNDLFKSITEVAGAVLI